MEAEAARDAFLASIQRDLNCITDADRGVRRKAFDTLTKRCVTRDRRVDYE